MRFLATFVKLVSTCAINVTREKIDIMAQDNFMSFRRHRYLKLAVGLICLCIVLYVRDTPPVKPGGGTWLGYGLGTLGALLILFLLAFGMRKRAYNSQLGSVRGWLSAHVYLGIALALVATLHAAFEFGWNIHTLAYALTIVVILSGFWGMVLYLRQPTRMSNLLDGLTLQQIGEKLTEIDDRCKMLATKLDAKTQALVAESAKCQIFASYRQRLTGNNRSCATKRVLAQMGMDSSQGSKEHNEIYTLQLRRSQQLNRIREFVRLRTWTEIWLLCHVPLSIALLMALIAHIVSVFFYW